MLLLPEGNQRRLDPMAQSLQPVDAGVAGGTESNQPAAVMEAGPTVMHAELPLRPTAAAAAAVALENRVAMAGEAKPRVRPASIAAPAQTGSPEEGVATRTEKPGLPTPQGSIAGR
jgi:hypothetical protein